MADNTKDAPINETEASGKAESSETPKAVSDSPNIVQVIPGGATFPTITAALASITDNKLQKQYILYVGPGTYNEKVTMKPYVSIQGAGRDQTFITAPAAADAFSGGTVIAASHCTLGNVTVSSLGGVWGSYSTALSCSGVINFSCDNSALIVNDQNQAGVNQGTVTVDFNYYGTPSVVYINYCAINCTAQNSESGASCLNVWSKATTQLIESKLVATGGRQPFGVLTAWGGIATLDDCYIEGAYFALYDSDGISPITANSCQINGPVSNGVTINNNNSSSGD
jgi:hypothetical protein